jgi:hypothetical protein
VDGMQRPLVLAMQEDCELLSNGLAFRAHRGFEQIMLGFLRQTAPTPSDRMAKRSRHVGRDIGRQLFDGETGLGHFNSSLARSVLRGWLNHRRVGHVVSVL